MQRPNFQAAVCSSDVSVGQSNCTPHAACYCCFLGSYCSHNVAVVNAKAFAYMTLEKPDGLAKSSGCGFGCGGGFFGFVGFGCFSPCCFPLNYTRDNVLP